MLTAELDAMAASLAAVCAAPLSTARQTDALSTVLAEDCGFAGDRLDYDDPDNADMIAVLDRRLGLPITLSILYVAMARRQDWTAVPMNTPGHVLVRLGTAVEPLIIDPFNGGRVVQTEQVVALVQRMTGLATARDDALPMSNRSAIVRLLLNQATRAERGGDPALYERMTGVAPMQPQAWRERARLQLAAHDVSGARGSLSPMLEITRDEDLRPQISATLDSLPRPT